MFFLLSNGKYLFSNCKKSVIEACFWHTIFERESSSLFMFEKLESVWINLNLLQSNAWCPHAEIESLQPRKNKLEHCHPRSLPSLPPPPLRFITRRIRRSFDVSFFHSSILSLFFFLFLLNEWKVKRLKRETQEIWFWIICFSLIMALKLKTMNPRHSEESQWCNHMLGMS